MVSPEAQDRLDRDLGRVLRSTRRYLWLSHAAEAVLIIGLALAVAVLSLRVEALSQQATVQSKAAAVRSREAAERASAAQAAAESFARSVFAGSCPFWYDLGTAVLSDPLTELGAKLVADSRNAFVSARCAGVLPAPSPLLRAAAARYRIPLHG